MQFPWRDYVWCLLLLSLAIGLAVEQTRVRRFTARRDDANKSEQAARQLADQLAAAGDLQVEIKEFMHVTLRPSLRFVDIEFVSSTDERKIRSLPVWTGEFDFITLPILMMVPNFLLWTFIPGFIHRPGSKFSRKQFLAGRFFQFLYMLAFSIWFYSPPGPLQFIGSKPISGAICLFTGAVILARLLFFASLNRDELENLVQQSSGKWRNVKAVRERLRFQLRDIFWLMLVIGLGCAVYLEHDRSLNLSQHQGRAEWWRRATVVLQEELKKVS